MRVFGLIGFPLTHSFSKSYFTRKWVNENIGDTVYENFPIQDIEELNHLITDNSDLLALNVTSPYKQSVIPFLSESDQIVKETDSVNVIKIIRDSQNIRLKGYNTDVYGFTTSLFQNIKQPLKYALILGTGGAASAVAYAFRQNGIGYKFVSRTNPMNRQDIITYSELKPDYLKTYKLIVNSTPLGTFPNIDTRPDIPYQYLNKDNILFDLVYNPAKTLFLKSGEDRGAKIINGYDMLVYQAEKSWEIFTVEA
jgi:shikimate dehydrogenase